MKKFYLAFVALAVVATTADAVGPHRFRILPRNRSHGTENKASAPSPVSSSVQAATMPVSTAAPSAMPSPKDVAGGAAVATATSVVRAMDALDEVNAKRAQRGLYPYARDEGLMAGAAAAASYRAAYHMFGHTRNDFGFLPPGSHASAAGCAGNSAGYGFMACDVYSRRFTTAGAAMVIGTDGRAYCHLFVR